MAKLLDQYLQKQAEIRDQIAANALRGDSLIIMQEVTYRICVLEIFQSYCLAAPQTMDFCVMGYHYQLVDANIQFLLSERKFGPKVDENGKKKRETAEDSLNRVIADQRKRFSNYRPMTQGQFRKDICAMVNTILPVWVSYRNTYINI